MKKALVTGVTGFIGGALVRRLVKENCKVAVIVRKTSDLGVFSDIQPELQVFVYDGSVDCLIQILEEYKPDIVYHLASLYLAEHAPGDIVKLIESNVLFGTQLLESMKLSEVKRIVNTGTSWQHYHSQGYRATNLYAATKQAFSDILDFYNDKHDISQVTLKLFDTYGPGDKRKKLVNLIVNALKTNSELGVSPGEQVVDISYIDDVVESFYECGKYMCSSNDVLTGEYFVTGERFTVKELVDEISSAFGRKAKITYGVRPYREREVMTLPDVSGKVPPWSEKIKTTLLKSGALKV